MPSGSGATMANTSEPDPIALGRVVGAADVLLRAASRLVDAERDLVCRHLSERSEMFRRAHGWTKLLGLAFLVGPLLLLFAVIAGFVGAPALVSMTSANAAVVITGVPAIQVYRVARNALDIAVGAYLVALERGNRESG